MSGYGFSDIECKIILNQIERRAKLRKEFQRLKSDPCKHSMESGFVFDPAIQRYLSMKACQLEHFQANPKTIRMGLLTILPMFAYGYLLWSTRQKFERDCRCGAIRYRDRMFKFQ